jgi:hypothetical protein
MGYPYKGARYRMNETEKLELAETVIKDANEDIEQLLEEIGKLRDIIAVSLNIADGAGGDEGIDFLRHQAMELGIVDSDDS